MPSTATTVFALIFSDHGVPEGSYEEIHLLHNDGAIEVLDVSEFEIKENGKIKFERAMTLPLIGVSDGFFLEAFVGLLFFQSPHGGNVVRALSEIHLDQEFIRELTAHGTAGSSALFLHVKGAPPMSAFKNLIPHAQKSLSIALTHEQQSKLEILFHGKRSPEFAAEGLQLH